ncbi:hypothetical protein GF374_03630 [Candidatus Woesearchaeota archaeon]|nr:hypothetical protein [Candidatus Woesearchaeota archaeon]
MLRRQFLYDPDPDTASADPPDDATQTTGRSGGDAFDWKSLLSDEQKADPTIANTKDLPALADQLINAQKMVGSDKVTLPGKDAKPEEWDKFYAKLGRPEKAEDYDFTETQVPEGLTVGDDDVTAFRQIAHELGLSKKQAARLYDFEIQRMGQQIDTAKTAIEQRNAEATENLKKEYGAAYDQNIALAQQLVTEYGGDDLKAFLNETGLGNDARMIRFAVKLARERAEDDLLGKAKHEMALSPQEARQRIAELQRDKDFMEQYTDSNHAGHAQAVKQMNDLYRQVAGGDKPSKREPVVARVDRG